jgi:hypothetical protein
VKNLRIAFEGLTLTGHLFEDKAPKICQALWDALPLEGSVTNVTWSGNMLRLWVKISEPPEPENVSELQHPGDILFVPRWNGLRFVYGPAQMRGPAGAHPVPRIGRLGGDLTDFVKLAKTVEWEGAKKMTVARG